MALTKVTNGGITDSAITSAKIDDGSITNVDIKSDAAIPASKLSATLDLSSKTITLPSASVTAHATTPTLDSPSITGTLFVDSGSTVSHTISNWSDDVTYVITPTNCTVGSINTSGVFVVTHTSGTPSYTIKATTDSLGLADSSVVTKNIALSAAMTAPSLNAPADSDDATAVTYTISSIDSNATKVIFDAQSSNFTYGSVGSGSGTKVGNTVEITGWSGTSVTVTLTYTTVATYSNRAKVQSTADAYTDSAYSSTDSIVISASVNYIAATGGTITTSGDYKYHKFTSSGTFTVSSVGDSGADWVIVAGAGGGGGGGGGGGAGGMRTGTNYTVSAQGYSIIIGGGGSAGATSGGSGGEGTASSALGYSSLYGGRGEGSQMNNPSSGGSGGGGTGNGSGTGASGTSGQGNSGGNGNDGGANQGSGGGGGKNASGGNATSTIGGNGGAGQSWNSQGTFAGGGGGGANGTGGSGGSGGGGNGSGGSTGASGTTNTGGGGGGSPYTGGGSSPAGGSGGSGVVIIRYKYQN